MAILTTIILGAWGLYRYFEKRGAEIRSREEERFEGVVQSLGSEHTEARVSASVLLSTFLSPQYARFHEQIFNLAAGHLRTEMSANEVPNPTTKVELPGTVSEMEIIVKNASHLEAGSGPFNNVSHSNENLTGAPFRTSSAIVSSSPSPNSLVQGLANVFSKSYRLARDARVRHYEGDVAILASQYLNASGVRLDGTYLGEYRSALRVVA